jgi:hypothetical protein
VADAKEHEAVREKAIWSISRIGDARQASMIAAILLDKTAPTFVRRTAARSFAAEKLQDRRATTSLMTVFRDKSENQFVRVDTAAALQGFEHRFHDPQIAEAFKSVRMDRSEPAAIRAAARTVQQMLDKIKADSTILTAASKGGFSASAQDLPYGKKAWSAGRAGNRSQTGQRTVVELRAEGERAEIKAWYDRQFADWKVFKEWNGREIAVMMNGEWKVWHKSNLCCLIVIHEKEKRGGMDTLHVFDREEEMQDLLAEIPEDVAHLEKCKRNLQAIESGKGSAIRKFRLQPGNTIEIEQLSALIPGGYESLTCPDAGTYNIGHIGKAARCSVHGTQTAMRRR